MDLLILWKGLDRRRFRRCCRRQWIISIDPIVNNWWLLQDQNVITMRCIQSWPFVVISAQILQRLLSVSQLFFHFIRFCHIFSACAENWAHIHHTNDDILNELRIDKASLIRFRIMIAYSVSFALTYFITLSLITYPFFVPHSKYFL